MIINEIDIPDYLLNPIMVKTINKLYLEDKETVFVKQYSKKTPLKRLGRAEEIASSALFLASDAASYITGATLMVDGGWTVV